MRGTRRLSKPPSSNVPHVHLPLAGGVHVAPVKSLLLCRVVHVPVGWVCGVPEPEVVPEVAALPDLALVVRLPEGGPGQREEEKEEGEGEGEGRECCHPRRCLERSDEDKEYDVTHKPIYRLKSNIEIFGHFSIFFSSTFRNYFLL